MKFSKYLLIMLLCCNFNLFGSEVDSLLALLSNSKNEARVDILSALATKIWFSEPKKSIDFCNEAIMTARKINYKKGEGQALNYLGVTYLITGDNTAALDYCRKALDIFRNIRDSVYIAYSMRTIADVFDAFGNIDSAMNFYISSLKIYDRLVEKHKDSKFIKSYGILLNNMGVFLTNINKYDDAIKYLEMGLKEYQKINSQQGIASAYSGLGIAAFYNKDINKSTEYFEEALSIAKSLNNKNFIANTLHNLAVNYQHLNDNKKALRNFLEAQPILEEIGDKMGLFNNLIGISQMQRESFKDYDKAFEYLHKALKIAQEMESRQALISAYSAFYTLNKDKGNFKEALRYKELSSSLQDSLNNIEKSRQIDELKIQYETERKEKENSVLMQQNEIKTNRIVFISIITFLSLVLTVFLFFRYKSKQRTNKILEENNRLITEQNVELDLLLSQVTSKSVELNKANYELQNANATKDKFFSIIAHDLKGPIGAFSTTTDILAEFYDKMDDEEKKKFILMLGHSAKDLLSLLQNLLTWSRNQRGIIEFEPERLDISKIIEETISVLQVQAENKNIEITCNYNGAMKACCDENMIQTVVRNLISNAIKFSHRNGKICIEINDSEYFIEFSIKDSGVGISPDALAKLFRIDISIKEYGTEMEKGTGLGLILCKEFIDKHKGTIWVESEEGKGSTFHFSLPKVYENNES